MLITTLVRVMGLMEAVSDSCWILMSPSIGFGWEMMGLRRSLGVEAGEVRTAVAEEKGNEILGTL